MKPMLRYNPSTAGEQQALRKKVCYGVSGMFWGNAYLKRRWKETAQPFIWRFVG